MIPLANVSDRDERKLLEADLAILEESIPNRPDTGDGKWPRLIRSAMHGEPSTAQGAFDVVRRYRTEDPRFQSLSHDGAQKLGLGYRLSSDHDVAASWVATTGKGKP